MKKLITPSIIIVLTLLWVLIFGYIMFSAFYAEKIYKVNEYEIIFSQKDKEKVKAYNMFNKHIKDSIRLSKKSNELYKEMEKDSSNMVSSDIMLEFCLHEKYLLTKYRMGRNPLRYKFEIKRYDEDICDFSYSISFNRARLDLRGTEWVETKCVMPDYFLVKIKIYNTEKVLRKTEEIKLFIEKKDEDYIHKQGVIQNMYINKDENYEIEVLPVCTLIDEQIKRYTNEIKHYKNTRKNKVDSCYTLINSMKKEIKKNTDEFYNSEYYKTLLK